MKPIRYTDAVPPMPDHFKNAMLDTLEGLESMKTEVITLTLSLSSSTRIALSTTDACSL